VLPTVGSKELVALLPSLLGLGEGDVVVHPTTAYPTYDVGARLAGATPLPADDVAVWGDAPVRLVWINSPGNPDGTVRSVEQLRAVVDAARAVGAVVASDECYAELAWDEPWAGDGVPSVLDPRVSGGDPTGLLAVYSLSKQSNLAGYRAAFVAGDPGLVRRLLELRKHAGMIVPAPVQAAMTVALADDAHVDVQRGRYRARRAALLDAVGHAGLTLDGSQAGLYLWLRPADDGAPGDLSSGDPTTGDRTGGAAGDGWRTVARLAERGILVAPGSFYGAAAAGHVRMALTGTDERIAEAVRRLTA
jgi:succinyldiaminopimelate transaminase